MLLPVVAGGQQAVPNQAPEGLLSQIEALEARLERDLKAQHRAEADLREAETEIARLREAASRAQIQLVGRRTQQERLAAELERSDAASRRTQRALAAAIQRAWRGGRQGHLKALLGGARAGDINRRLTWAEMLLRSWAEGARDSVLRAAEVQRIRGEASGVEQQLAALKARQARRIEDIERAAASRQATLEGLRQRIGAAGEQIEQLKARAATLASLAEDIGQIVQQHPAAPLPSILAARGQLEWPLKGRVLRRFGAGPGGGQASWDGILLQAEEGAEVRAAHAGRVVFADWVRGLGFLIVLDHGESVLSLYAYNDRLLGEKGETVSKGQVIARAGSTGGRREAGLYFAIRRNGEPVDPVEWLNR